ncbi:5-oxoprolinase subunit PxpB [Kangiella sp. HZ709]|uniref:5-oxoprolinase subunit PxpB n=1 Tax=Kangiella sp. HZ709 TaxID=2666328 RepID=UPI0012AFD6AE|nr:5-oxoprolinase subunit PxpB [Kangiella sp. HZ709]MRX27556.1 5-oxoprolinase subunit PxpB [Kangiella sp. HZ709]
MLFHNFSIHINSDCSLLVQFEEKPNLKLTEFIHSFIASIPQLNLKSYTESVAAYQSILLIFDPLNWNYQESIKQLEQCLSKFEPSKFFEPKIIKIPVCYDSRVAKDLTAFCEVKNISIKELIALHTKPSYRVEMLGFLPGFLYLFGLNEKISLPRKSVPDVKIPAGSVAIGGTQTGIYPIDSPGGWHIIGRTPISLFTPKQKPPAIANPLDFIQFEAISYDEYLNYVD